MLSFTLWGLYQYDPSLFDNITIPDKLDKNILVNCLLAECGELFPVHQVPFQFKTDMQYWFNRHMIPFSKMTDAIQADFNPIENYDRYEDITDSMRNSGKSSSKGTSTSENKVSAENVNTYQPNNINNAGSDLNSDTLAEGENKRVAHIHGNIGVTTASAMIKEVYDMQMRYGDIYRTISKMFENDLLRQIY